MVTALLRKARGAVIASLLAMMAMPGIGMAAGNSYVLAHMFDEGSLPDLAAQRFAQLVRQYGGGDVGIDIHGAGLLGDERNNLLQLKQGDIAFAVTGDLVVSYLVPEFSAVNMPFIYRSPEHALKVYDGPIGDTIRHRLEEDHQIQALSWHYIGTRLLTANEPLGNVQALVGLKLRLPPDAVWKATWTALGADPRAVPFTELFPALKRKRVDAQENPPNFIRAKGIQQVQRYLILTNHMPQRQFILANGEALAAMAPEHREVVLRAARETSAWVTEQAKWQQQSDIDWLRKEGGMRVLKFNAEGIREKLDGVPAGLPGNGKQLFEQILSNY
jgi:tripartite ATP-independent transporter DctP family solute receptor